MEVIAQEIPDVLLIKPKVFGDERGYFVETYQTERYATAGMRAPFVQDNMSRSRHGTLRGLHLQEPHGQGKLVTVLEGEVFDVAVDVRMGSPYFGRWVAAWLSAQNHHQMYIPPGFAHGFCVTSEHALFSYKCTELYHPESELGVAYNDPELAITWPVATPLVSGKDQQNAPLSQIDRAKLPRYAEARDAGRARDDEGRA
ncbi:MAG TPA: dTDP-4-dehydrorhamnose 3,5-epimerase [Polyangiaceae bacterium]|nr:dTDP-4-dehydrorhamnose 3,5-epimerase [Polyangiaceae bacterium]